MTVSGTIIDEETGQPLPGGQIYTADQNGNAVAVARGNDIGAFSLEVPDTSPKIMVVAPGYAARMVDPGEVSGSEPVGLTPISMAADQPTAVIPNNTASSIPWYVWVAGVGIVVFALTDDKKKKIGDASSYIIPLGIVGAIAFILYKFGLFGNNASSSNNAAATAAISQSTTQTLAALSVKGINPTLTPAQAASIANTIFSAGNSVIGGDNSGVQTIFDLLGINCQNDADIYLIMQSFGTRNMNNGSWLSTCAILKIDCDAIDLEGFITAVLNQANIPGSSVADLNNLLQTNELGPTGITYNF